MRFHALDGSVVIEDMQYHENLNIVEIVSDIIDEYFQSVEDEDVEDNNMENNQEELDENDLLEDGDKHIFG